MPYLSEAQTKANDQAYTVPLEFTTALFTLFG